MSELANFMAAVRHVESGSAEGDYSHRQAPVNGLIARGAYGFTNWRNQAMSAGLVGANLADRAAQDRVAATLFREMYERYGSWDLVALAWFTNEKTADQAKKGGYRSLDQIRNPQVKEYIQSIVNAKTEADSSDIEYSAPRDYVPLREPAPEPVQPPRVHKASELMAAFVDQLSARNAGGGRTPIDELAPKIIHTPGEEEPVAGDNSEPETEKGQEA